MIYIDPSISVCKPRSSTPSDLWFSLSYWPHIFLCTLPLQFMISLQVSRAFCALSEVVESGERGKCIDIPRQPSHSRCDGAKATFISTLVLVPPPHPYFSPILLLLGRSIGTTVITMDNTRILPPPQQRGGSTWTGRLMRSNLRPIVLFSTCSSAPVALDNRI